MANAALANANSENNVTSMGEVLPVDPFRSLYVHFGMLLGVEDFRTVDAYHRGKMWFHSGWLHRQGVIWGLAVSIDQEHSEIRVQPGAALDGLGRELFLAQPACLNIDAWYTEHKDDPELKEIVQVDEESGEVRFDAHVVIQFKACLNRQVPALTEPCDGSNSTTAYSRVLETVELCLIPGKAPEWRADPGQLPFHRVRLLFGLEPPLKDDDGVVIDDDQEVLDAQAAILALPGEEQSAAYLKSLRHFSVFDEMELTPAAVEQGDSFSIFPAADPDPIALADLPQLRLLPTDAGWQVESGSVDNTVRPVHIPTSTIQELVCGPAFVASVSGGGSPPVTPPAAADAGGPRIDPASVVINGEIIQFSIEGGPLMKASADARAISVTSFDIRDGWISSEIKKVRYNETNALVEIELRDQPGGNLLRLIVKGTGGYPFLGRNRIPLAGSTLGSAEAMPGSKIDGNDFVTMLRVRS